eukprot:3973990-Ditylum_brightwellii.AAC.1
MTVCCLTSKQKYAILRQGVTNVGEMELLGPGLNDIQSTLKVFNSLSDARGGVNFGATHYQKILAL